MNVKVNRNADKKKSGELMVFVPCHLVLVTNNIFFFTETKPQTDHLAVGQKREKDVTGILQQMSNTRQSDRCTVNCKNT